MKGHLLYKAIYKKLENCILFTYTEIFSDSIKAFVGKVNTKCRLKFTFGEIKKEIRSFPFSIQGTSSIQKYFRVYRVLEVYLYCFTFKKIQNKYEKVQGLDIVRW